MPWLRATVLVGAKREKPGLVHTFVVFVFSQTKWNVLNMICSLQCVRRNRNQYTCTYIPGKVFVSHDIFLRPLLLILDIL